jgi:hypothetical protein
MPPADTVAPWLSFISTLIWQLIIVGALIYFRQRLDVLLSKQPRRLKVGGGGVELEWGLEQPPSPEALSPGGEAEADFVLPAGFLSSDDVTRLIADSGLVQPGEKVTRTLLLFDTKRQRTWLVATNQQLFCLLDGEHSSQWAAHSVENEPRSSKTG